MLQKDKLYEPITPEVLETIRLINEEKLKAAKDYLGNKWLLHPENRNNKLKKKRKHNV